jgi:hypothetical protein
MNELNNSAIAFIWSKGYRIKKSESKDGDIVVHFSKIIKDSEDVRRKIVGKIQPYFNKHASEKKIKFIICLLRILMIFFCCMRKKAKE